MNVRFIVLLGLVGFFINASALADASLLKLEKINDSAYAVVGPFGDRTPQNLGNNATSGFVVTTDGVVLIDPGGSYKGAADIESVIASVTDTPVKVVINSGGQDHRWLGNGYFAERGATIIANEKAVIDQQERLQEQLLRLTNLIGESGLEGTEAVYADTQFKDHHQLVFGGVTFDLHHKGQAHTPGDSFVHIANMGVVFSGDIVYIGRMLGVMEHSSSRSWIDVFEQMAALEPEYIVPGHGSVTNIIEAGQDTLGYLTDLRQKIGSFIDDGGQIEDISSIDHSDYSYLISFDALKGRNAQQVFQEMEWE